MALGWFSLQQKWEPGIFSGGKSGRCVRRTTLPPSCADCLEIWEPQPSGTLRVCKGIVFSLPYKINLHGNFAPLICAPLYSAFD